MDYKVESTYEMERLLELCVTYLMDELHNQQAARHLLNEVEKLYNRISFSPYIYRISNDPVLAFAGYREATLPDMNYIVIYKIVDNTVYVMGIYHSKQNYVSMILSNSNN